MCLVQLEAASSLDRLALTAHFSLLPGLCQVSRRQAFPLSETHTINLTLGSASSSGLPALFMVWTCFSFWSDTLALHTV